MKDNYEGIICRGSYIFGSACGHCEKCKDELEDIKKRKEERLAVPYTRHDNIEQYKKYPALYNLLDMLEKDKRPKSVKFVLNRVAEYNSCIKNVFSISDIEPQKKMYFADLVRKDFCSKLEHHCTRLNDIERDHLKNYFHAKVREFYRKNPPIRTREWQLYRENLNSSKRQKNV